MRQAVERLDLDQLQCFVARALDHYGTRVAERVGLFEESDALAAQLGGPGVEIGDADRREAEMQSKPLAAGSTAGRGGLAAACRSREPGRRHRNGRTTNREEDLMLIGPVTLDGQHVRLEPVSLDHVPALWRAGAHEAIWRYFPYTMRSEEEMRAYVASELAKQEAGLVVRFVTVARAITQPVGSTSYLNIDRQHRRVEIGGTWITPAWQRSAINTEAKYLQLRHAFETLGCIRVEFKTDALNTKSRQALTRIGATEEGTFRNHMIMPGGRIRHSVYFSITHDEWPRVKVHLEGLLSSYPPSSAVLPPSPGGRGEA
jgi:N-acetyltransferase